MNTVEAHPNIRSNKSTQSGSNKTNSDKFELDHQNIVSWNQFDSQTTNTCGGGQEARKQKIKNWVMGQKHVMDLEKLTIKSLKREKKTRKKYKQNRSNQLKTIDENRTKEKTQKKKKQHWKRYNSHKTCRQIGTIATKKKTNGKGKVANYPSEGK